MKRHIISLIVASALVFGLSVTASAATTKQNRAAEALYHLDLFKGKTTTGKNFALDDPLNRAEGTLMVIRLLGKEEEAYTRDVANTPFTDVATFWSGNNEFIAYAYETGLVKGVTTTTFEPKTAMSDRMFLTMILRVLGYQDGDNNYIWYNAWQLAHDAGLVDSTAKDAEFTRSDAVLVAWKAMGVTLQGSTKTLAQKLMGEGLFTAAEYADAKEIWTCGSIQDDDSGYTPSTPSTPSTPTTPTTPSVPGTPSVPSTPTVPDAGGDNADNSGGDTADGGSLTQPWAAEGAKQPSEYTWAEFEALTGAQREAFVEWFETVEDFDAWMNSAQSAVTALPWENGGKQPSEYTWAEFEALTGAQREAFVDSFSSAEEFDAWMTAAQSTTAALPWENGGKQPSEYTWAEFETLTAAQREAFADSFASVEEFDAWMTAAQSTTAALPWENGGKQPSEYTWAEFEALTAAQREAFVDSFASVEEFDAWMTAAQSTTVALPWESGGKQPSEYTWAEFEALTAAQREAFVDSFSDIEEFDAWLTANQP